MRLGSGDYLSVAGKDSKDSKDRVKSGAISEAFAKWAFLAPTPPKTLRISSSYASKKPIAQMPGCEVRLT